MAAFIIIIIRKNQMKLYLSYVHNQRSKLLPQYLAINTSKPQRDKHLKTPEAASKNVCFSSKLMNQLFTSSPIHFVPFSPLLIKLIIQQNTVTSCHSPTHRRIQPQDQCRDYMGPKEPAYAVPRASVFLRKLDEMLCHLFL